MDIIKAIEEHIEIMDNLKKSSGKIQALGDILVKTLKNGNKVLIMGNGGSAADSQHIAAEIVGRYKRRERDFLRLHYQQTPLS